MWECVNSNLSQTSQAGGTKGDQPECGSAGEKGRDSPLSRAITFCRQGSRASRPEGPSRGGCSVLFQRILPPFTSHPLVFDVVGLPRPGCVVPLGEAVAVLLLHAVSPNESPSPHHVGGIAGTKNRTDKDCDPIPAQPADRAGVAPHPGEDLQVFCRAG